MSYVIGAFILAVNALAVGVGSGMLLAQHRLWNEIVRRGFGHWDRDDEGHKTFVWNETNESR